MSEGNLAQAEYFKDVAYSPEPVYCGIRSTRCASVRRARATAEFVQPCRENAPAASVLGFPERTMPPRELRTVEHVGRNIFHGECRVGVAPDILAAQAAALESGHKSAGPVGCWLGLASIIQSKGVTAVLHRPPAV